jgi:arginine repressor
MAKKAAKEGVSKTEATGQFMAKNPNATVKEIVAGVKEQGVEISASLANKLKYSRPKKGTAKKNAAKKSVAAKGRRKKKSASTNGAAGRGHKAEAIRGAARKLGKKVRPRDVIAMLKEQGITVSSAQVSTTLKAMGMRKVRRGRKPGAVASAASRSDSISINDLVAAKRLVNQLGSVEAVSQALSALARLS